MFRKKLMAWITAGTLACAALCSTGVNAAPKENRGMRDITTMELVREMGIGINLGNTMEACGDWIAQYSDGKPTDYETAWGSPVITQPMIQGMADEGFGVVRVPVAWSNMMGENYQISPEYTARVQQIVDWVIDADMYCIINIHWDNGWVNKFPDNQDECMHRYEVMWTQIAAAFADYDDHLMFESQNEELGWDSVWNPWGGSEAEKQASYALANEINQKFVDVIRSSVGNNPQRHLLISGYNTDFGRTCDPLFKMPDDPANRMAISVHYYTPAGFALLEEDASWAKMRPTWGTDEDFRELNEQMDMMKTHYIDKGIPVIIGEYGCPTKGKEPDSVRLFLSSVCKAAYDRQLCPVLWSTPGGHYDRETCKLCDQELKRQFNEISGFDPNSRPTEESTTEPTTEPITEPTTETTNVPEVISGDIDGDGALSVADIILFQKWLLGQRVEMANAMAADCNGDGVLDIYDMGLLKRELMK